MALSINAIKLQILKELQNKDKLQLQEQHLFVDLNNQVTRKKAIRNYLLYLHPDKVEKSVNEDATIVAKILTDLMTSNVRSESPIKPQFSLLALLKPLLINKGVTEELNLNTLLNGCDTPFQRLNTINNTAFSVAIDSGNTEILRFLMPYVLKQTNSNALLSEMMQRTKSPSQVQYLITLGATLSEATKNQMKASFEPEQQQELERIYKFRTLYARHKENNWPASEINNQFITTAMTLDTQQFIQLNEALSEEAKQRLYGYNRQEFRQYVLDSVERTIIILSSLPEGERQCFIKEVGFAKLYVALPTLDDWFKVYELLPVEQQLGFLQNFQPQDFMAHYGQVDTPKLRLLIKSQPAYWPVSILAVGTDSSLATIEIYKILSEENQVSFLQSPKLYQKSLFNTASDFNRVYSDLSEEHKVIFACKVPNEELIECIGTNVSAFTWLMGQLPAKKWESLLELYLSERNKEFMVLLPHMDKELRIRLIEPLQPSKAHQLFSNITSLQGYCRGLPKNKQQEMIHKLSLSHLASKVENFNQVLWFLNRLDEQQQDEFLSHIDSEIDVSKQVACATDLLCIVKVLSWQYERTENIDKTAKALCAFIKSDTTLTLSDIDQCLSSIPKKILQKDSELISTLLSSYLNGARNGYRDVVVPKRGNTKAALDFIPAMTAAIESSEYYEWQKLRLHCLMRQNILSPSISAQSSLLQKLESFEADRFERKIASFNFIKRWVYRVGFYFGFQKSQSYISLGREIGKQPSTLLGILAACMENTDFINDEPEKDTLIELLSKKKFIEFLQQCQPKTKQSLMTNERNLSSLLTRATPETRIEIIHALFQECKAEQKSNFILKILKVANLTLLEKILHNNVLKEFIIDSIKIPSGLMASEEVDLTKKQLIIRNLTQVDLAGYLPDSFAKAIKQYNEHICMLPTSEQDDFIRRLPLNEIADSIDSSNENTIALLEALNESSLKKFLHLTPPSIASNLFRFILEEEDDGYDFSEISQLKNVIVEHISSEYNYWRKRVYTDDEVVDKLHDAEFLKRVKTRLSDGLLKQFYQSLDSSLFSSLLDESEAIQRVFVPTLKLANTHGHLSAVMEVLSEEQIVSFLLSPDKAIAFIAHSDDALLYAIVKSIPLHIMQNFVSEQPKVSTLLLNKLNVNVLPEVIESLSSKSFRSNPEAFLYYMQSISPYRAKILLQSVQKDFPLTIQKLISLLSCFNSQEDATDPTPILDLTEAVMLFHENKLSKLFIEDETSFLNAILEFPQRHRTALLAQLGPQLEQQIQTYTDFCRVIEALSPIEKIKGDFVSVIKGYYSAKDLVELDQDIFNHLLRYYSLSELSKLRLNTIKQVLDDETVLQAIERDGAISENLSFFEPYLKANSHNLNWLLTFHQRIVKKITVSSDGHEEIEKIMVLFKKNLNGIKVFSIHTIEEFKLAFSLLDDGQLPYLFKSLDQNLITMLAENDLITTYLEKLPTAELKKEFLQSCHMKIANTDLYVKFVEALPTSEVTLLLSIIQKKPKQPIANSSALFALLRNGSEGKQTAFITALSKDAEMLNLSSYPVMSQYLDSLNASDKQRFIRYWVLQQSDDQHQSCLLSMEKAQPRYLVEKGLFCLDELLQDMPESIPQISNAKLLNEQANTEKNLFRLGNRIAMLAEHLVKDKDELKNHLYPRCNSALLKGVLKNSGHRFHFGTAIVMKYYEDINDCFMQLADTIEQYTTHKKDFREITQLLGQEREYKPSGNELAEVTKHLEAFISSNYAALASKKEFATAHVTSPRTLVDKGAKTLLKQLDLLREDIKELMPVPESLAIAPRDL